MSFDGDSMPPRERFHDTAHFGQPDRVFLLRSWYWEITLERWHREGLPVDVTPIECFGTDAMVGVPVNTGPIGPVGGVIGLPQPSSALCWRRMTGTSSCARKTDKS